MNKLYFHKLLFLKKINHNVIGRTKINDFYGTYNILFLEKKHITNDNNNFLYNIDHIKNIYIFLKKNSIIIIIITIVSCLIRRLVVYIQQYIIDLHRHYIHYRVLLLVHH